MSMKLMLIKNYKKRKEITKITKILLRITTIKINQIKRIRLIKIKKKSIVTKIVQVNFIINNKINIKLIKIFIKILTWNLKIILNLFNIFLKLE